MPADPNIYGMIRQPTPMQGPLDQFAQIQTVKNLMDQGQMHGLQRQQLERSMADDESVRSAFSGMQPGQKIGDILPQIYKASPKTGMAVQKNLTEQEKATADLGKTKLETMALEGKQLRDLAAQVTSDADMPAAREAALRIVGPDKFKQLQFFNQPFNPEARMKAISSADEILKQIEAQKGRDVTTRGQDLTDARTRSEGAANRAVTVAGHGETARHNQVTESQEQFGPAQEVTGPNGSPVLVMQNKKNGQMVDANTRQPISGVGPKVGESAQKQQVGVQNTKNAIQDYRAALEGFSQSDIINPNARAKMGTVYNNMLLQAKEAFNLGVLNGPDYQILQEVITNPTSLKGGLTSKEALDAQASKLEEIMGRVGQTITATQSGQQPPQPPKAGPTQYSRAQIDAELKRRGIKR